MYCALRSFWAMMVEFGFLLQYYNFKNELPQQRRDEPPKEDMSYVKIFQALGIVSRV